MKKRSLAFFACAALSALVSCKACNGDEERIDVCDKVETLEGTRYDCDTHQRYARCVAHLLEGEISWCRYSGPLDGRYAPVAQDLFDVRRATAGEQAWIREQCPPNDLGQGVAGASATPEILECPDERLAQCLAYQRAGAPFFCVAQSAGLAELGLLRQHENTLHVDLENDAYEQANTVHGQIWARFSTPAAAPPSDRVCDPSDCGAAHCARDCIDMQLKGYVVELGLIPVGGLFAFWRADEIPGCPSAGSEQPCDCFGGSPVSVGARNEDQEVEAEICREVARIRGVTNTTFNIPWSHPGRVEGWYCFRDPYGRQAGSELVCGSECAFAKPGTYFAVPYQLSCNVTGASPCSDDVLAGNHSPSTAPFADAGSLTDLRLCAGRNDWFKVELCPGGRVRAVATSTDGSVRLGLFFGEPAAPEQSHPSDVDALDVSYTSALGGTVYIRAALADGFAARYDLTLEVEGSCRPDGGLDSSPSDGATDGGRLEGGLECLDVAGQWDLAVSNVDSSCGPEGDWSSIVTITQNGCGDGALDTVGIKGSTHVVKGSVVGNTVTIGPGDFAEAGGTTTATYTMQMTSPLTMSGTEAWTFSSATGSCTDGTANVSATRR